MSLLPPHSQRSSRTNSRVPGSASQRGPRSRSSSSRACVCRQLDQLWDTNRH